MLRQTPQKAELFARALRTGVLGVFAVFMAIAVVSLLRPQKTVAATSGTINFQARLENATGSIAADGYYNVEFKLYSASSGGTAEWTEDYTYSSGSGQCSGPVGANDCRARVANGYLTVNLGSITAFSGINWNQQQWLTMNIGGTNSSGTITYDGEMSPRLLLTATPYAFTSGSVSATASGHTGTLSFGSVSNDPVLTLPNETGTLCVENSANCGFAAASGSGSYVQLQGSSPGTAQGGSFNVTGTGIAATLQGSTTVQTPLLDTASGVTLNIGTTNATSINLGKTSSNIITTINGTALVKPTSGHDSSTAFQVQNASGSNLLTVDSSNTAIILGNDGTPAALTVRGGAATGGNVAGANLTFDASNGTGSGGSGDIIFRTAPGVATSQVSQDATSSASASSQSSLTWTHTTTASQSNLLMIVGVGITGSTNTVSSVTYNGAPLTKIGNIACASGGNCDEELWYMVAPATGAHSVIVTASGSSNIYAGAVTYYNANQSSPLGTPVTNTGGSSPSSVTVSTSASQTVVDGITDWSNGGLGSASAGQTQLWRLGGPNSGTSSKPGTAVSTTVGWSINYGNWAAIAVPVNSVGSSGADTLTDRLHITAAGNVGIDTANPQYTLDVTGTVHASTSVLAPLFDTASAGTLTVGNTNATAITLGNTSSNILTTINGTALVKPTSGHNSTAVFQVQNASGSNLLTVDSTNTAIVLGNDGTPSALTVRGGAATGNSVQGANLTFAASNGTGSGGSGDLIFQTAGPAANTAITLDNYQSETFGGGANTTVTWTHTPNSSTNSILIVSVATARNQAVAANGVTYEGTPLTKLSSQLCGNSVFSPYCEVELWYMVNPATTGTHQISVTLTPGSAVIGASSVTYDNVNTTTPFGTVNTISGSTSGNQQITNPVATTSTSQLVLDALASDNTTGTPGGAQLWSSNGNSFVLDNGSSNAANGGTTNVTWHVNSGDYADIGVPLNPVANTTPDTLTDRLHITATGNVGINTSSPQYTLDVTGTAHASTSVLAPLFDTASAGALAIGTTNATSISLGKTSSNILTTINGTALVKPTSGHNSTAVFQVQNASGSNLLTVDSSNTAIVLGNDGTPSALTVRGGAATGTNAAGSNLTVDASNGTGSGGSGDLIFRTAGAATDSVTLDNTSQGSNTVSGTTFSWSHTVTNHNNRVLLVSVSTSGSGHDVSGIMFGTQALTRIAKTSSTGPNGFIINTELWYLLQPNVTTASIAVTLVGAATDKMGGAEDYYNVNQTTPFGTSATNTGSCSGVACATSTTTSVTVSSNTTQLVVDGAAVQDDCTTGTGCPSSSIAGTNTGQTQNWNVNLGTEGNASAGSSKPGRASNTTMNWQVSSSTGSTGAGLEWAAVAVPLNPTTSAATTADTLTDRLHIAGNGNVGISTATPQYTLDVSGTGRFASTANSTTAFQVQNSSNSNVLDVDTTDGYLGVNVAAPSETLTLNQATGNNVIGFQTNGTAAGYIGVSNTAGNVITGSSVGDLLLRTQSHNILLGVNGAGAASVILNTSGNVGIGTMTPQAPLSVAGNAEFGAGDGGTPSAVTLRGAAASGTNVAGANLTVDASNGTGTGGSGDIIIRTAAAAAGGGSVTQDSVSAAQHNSGTTTLSWSHTVGSGSNRLLLVGVSTFNVDATTVKYGGVNLTELGPAVQAGYLYSSIWYLKQPTPGPASIVVTLPSSNAIVAGSASYYNVDQTTPLGTIGTGTGNSKTATVTVSGTNTNQLVFDNFSYAANVGGWTPSQTQLWLDATFNGGAASSKAASATSTTVTWTNSGAGEDWADVAVPINPVSGGGPTADTLTDRLHVTSGGNVGINNASPQYTLDVTGTGNFSTSVLSPLFDTATATTLNIGTTNATSISLNENTAVASGKTFTVNGNTLVKTTSTTAFQVQDAGSNNLLTVDTSDGYVGIGNTTPSRTLDVLGNWGGNEDDNQQTNNASGTTTVTDATQALVYHLTANKTSGNNSSTTIFNVTGLPEVNGTFAYFLVRASHNSGLGTSAQQCMNVKINNGPLLLGTTICDTASNSAQFTNYHQFEVMRIGGFWTVIVSASSGAYPVTG